MTTVTATEAVVGLRKDCGDTVWFRYSVFDVSDYVRCIAYAVLSIKC